MPFAISSKKINKYKEQQQQKNFFQNLLEAECKPA